MWDIIITVLCIFIAIYLWITWNYDYWKKLGVPYIKPTFFLGNLKDLILIRKHRGEVYAEFYWKYPDEPAVGIFKMLWPELVLRDIDLIKAALIKEFPSFHDNEFESDIDNDPLFAYNPFLAKGEKWKALRTFHSQNQSSGKIKGMFPLMLEVCQDMSQFLKEKGAQPIETKYFSGQYTTDVVSSSIYGLKSNSFLDPNAEFRKMSSKLFERTWMFNVLFLLNSLFPSFNKIFKMRMPPKKKCRTIGVCTSVVNLQLQNEIPFSWKKVLTDFSIFILVPMTMIIPGIYFIQTIMKALSYGLTPLTTVVSLALLILEGTVLTSVLPKYIIWVVERADQYEMLSPCDPIS